MRSFDLVVIGSGPGGYVAAIRAAQLKLKTAIVERDRLGGICLNWGCIPSKALLTNARIYNEIKRAERWGIQVKGLELDLQQVIGRSRSVTASLSRGISYLMKKNAIEVIQGVARFSKSGELMVSSAGGDEEQNLQATHIILATGGRARTLPGVQVGARRILTYKDVLELKRVPRSMVIIGGGAIGVEFAYFYNSLGCKVKLVEMLEQVLPIEDVEVSRLLAREFQRQGIEVLTGRRVLRAEVLDQGVVVSLESRDGEQQDRRAGVVLNAVGVQGNTEDLNLNLVGVKVEKGWIKVDKWYRTDAPGVYAVGDAIGPPLLAHAASREAMICVNHITKRGPEALDYSTIPNCTYCQPQVASVGLTEKRARAEGYEVKVGKFPFQASGRARASQADEGFVKLVFDAGNRELLGAHIISEEATEMIGELGMAKALKCTYTDLLKAVRAHPTFSEAITEAAGMAFGEQIHL